MVCKLCPTRKFCWDKGNCESCEFGIAFNSLDKKIKRLKEKNEKLTVNMNTYGLAAKRLSEEKAEIFAEIERLMLDGAIGGKYAVKVINPDKFAELKKKYTEANDGKM